MKFAHISDTHMGSYNDNELYNLEKKTFYSIMDKCIEKEVDFIVISGDLFNSQNPDLSIVDDVVIKLKTIYDKGIHIYFVHGSHDYSLVGKSITDILISAGLLNNVFKANKIDGRLILEFTKDKKTGVKITGIPGKKGGNEKEYYKILDIGCLEKEDGFKIFVFHSGLKEFNNDYIPKNELISISCLPKNFNYYAGGHAHKRDDCKIDEYGRIAFPGIPFSVDKRLMNNDQKGFYIIHFDGSEIRLEPMYVDICTCVVRKIDSSDENAIKETINAVENSGKNSIVDISIIDVDGRGPDIKKELMNKIKGKNVIKTDIKVSKKSSKKDDEILDDIHIDINDDSGRSKIEDQCLKEGLDKISLREDGLTGEKGLILAKELLREIGIEMNEGESLTNYDNRTINIGKKLLKIDGV